jgi:rhamnosyltransferase
MRDVETARRPRVLVLLATYNGEPWLREQIDSILAQQDVEVHLEIGDDVSRDGTRALIASAWGNDPRVRLQPWSEGSGSAGANFRRLYRHVDPTGFDFVALADQDDVWLPGKLAAAVEVLQRTQAQGYSCAVQAFWPDGRQQVLGQQAQVRAADCLFEGAGQGCTFVLRVALFERVRQFCIDQAEATEALHYHDWLIYLLARAWRAPWHFDPRPWMRYRQHGGNEIGSRGSLTAVRRRLAMIRDGWFARQIVAAARLYRLAGGDDAAACALAEQAVSPPRGLRARLALAGQTLRHGRRRTADRWVLAVSVLAGWVF